MIIYMTTQGVGDAWVGNELRVISNAGVPFGLHALNRPRQTYFSSEDIAQMGKESQYIYPVSKARIIVDTALAPFRFGGRFWAALWNALSGERESARVRIVGLWHLGVACHWAAKLRKQDVSHIHSQWIHSGGTVAMFAAWLLNKSFSFTGHAADLFRERAALKDKIKRADFIVCISEFHRQFYIDNGADPQKLIICYCGIDTSHFSPVTQTSKKDGILRIISSGRLVEKKGFPVLVSACAELKKRGVAFTCLIGGSGPDEANLRARITAADLDEEITLTGEALKQEEIPEFMESGDVYCLPCVWASDNDVDGLPQMLMEAMACGLPAVSTQLVGIPDLVINEETGLLVPPNDEVALADALSRLASDPRLGAQLAKKGREHVTSTFDLPGSLDPLVNRFKNALESKS